MTPWKEKKYRKEIIDLLERKKIGYEPTDEILIDHLIDSINQYDMCNSMVSGTGINNADWGLLTRMGMAEKAIQVGYKALGISPAERSKLNTATAAPATIESIKKLWKE
jgi:hypothetical protein